jgi:hypothetical protein
LRFARSSEALVRRLDDMTCAGCHESRAVAGFHVLGQDAPGTTPGNALAVPFSPHVKSELARRRDYTMMLAQGGRADDARPFAERSGDTDNGYGAACGLGDPGFASWTCAEGLRCEPYESPASESVIGTCFPPALTIGDPCEPTRVSVNADPHRDRATGAGEHSCAALGGACEVASVGFPGGMCSASCDRLPGGASCGSIAVLTDFNACIARKAPFAECLAKNVVPRALRACSEDAPCRDDYICAKTGDGRGACIPPYFLFQMRVDGHWAP